MMMIDGRRSNLFIYLCKRTSCQFGQFKKKGGKKKKGKCGIYSWERESLGGKLED